MAAKELPDPELLRKLLRYEPETGKLFWKHRNACPGDSTKEIKRWNTRYANTEAFKVVSRHGYKVGWVCGKNQKSHRVIWAVVHGEWPKDNIDHINGDRSDNRISNLRVVNWTLNNRNSSLQKNSTTGVVGVFYNKRLRKWTAKIGRDGKGVYLGSFDTKVEAIAARQGAAIALGYHENHGR